MIIDQIRLTDMHLRKFLLLNRQVNHCMDLMGTAEQLGNDAAVSWLGSKIGPMVTLILENLRWFNSMAGGYVR